MHLCVGDTNHNFFVPYTLGSTYQWQVQDSSTIATITSGNGTEHIKIDLNNTGVFKLVVTETDVNGCNGSDSMQVIIHPLPQVDFVVSGNCLENLTIFTDIFIDINFNTF